jgi:DNA-binding transcriptional regulator YiaG
MTCRCGESQKKPAKHSFRRTVAGTTFAATTDVEGCAGCGEVYVPASLMIAFERAISSELARRGPVCDETFRWIRKAAGIERGDLAQMLGVTPETIAGWESERRPIDRSAWLLVAGIVLDGLEGPRAMRARLKVAHRTSPTTNGNAEVLLDLPPAGMIARVLSLLAGPIVFTVTDIADALDVDVTALRAQLSDLADLGLVVRPPPPANATEPQPEHWTPITRDVGALLGAAVTAGVDLDAPLPRSTTRMPSKEPPARPSSTWRATSS